MREHARSTSRRIAKLAPLFVIAALLLSACGGSNNTAGGAKKSFTLFMLPKFIGIAPFDLAHKGAAAYAASGNPSAAREAYRSCVARAHTPNVSECRVFAGP